MAKHYEIKLASQKEQADQKLYKNKNHSSSEGYKDNRNSSRAIHNNDLVRLWKTAGGTR